MEKKCFYVNLCLWEVTIKASQINLPFFVSSFRPQPKIYTVIKKPTFNSRNISFISQKRPDNHINTCPKEPEIRSHYLFICRQKIYYEQRFNPLTRVTDLSGMYKNVFLSLVRHSFVWFGWKYKPDCLHAYVLMRARYYLMLLDSNKIFAHYVN